MNWGGRVGMAFLGPSQDGQLMGPNVVITKRSFEDDVLGGNLEPCEAILRSLQKDPQARPTKIPKPDRLANGRTAIPQSCSPAILQPATPQSGNPGPPKNPVAPARLGEGPGSKAQRGGGEPL